MPETVSYLCFASGCLRTNSASSFFSHSSRSLRAFSTSSSVAIGRLPVEIPIVDHPPRLELRPRQRPLRHHLEARAHAALRLQPLAHRPLQGGDVLHRARVLH